MNKISIIIPVYNEAENIPIILNHLYKISSKKNIAEIIIVDGDSNDGTELAVKNFIVSYNFKDKNPQTSSGFCRHFIKFMSSGKGRAIQMNYGAKRASGTILYFLHADSFPPSNFDNYIIEYVEKGKLAGCFKMKFDSNHWWLKLSGWLTALPWRICRGGDQSLFISKKLFDRIGGYDERFKIYEDNEFISRLYHHNEFVVIPKWLITSARCYEKHGIWKTQFYFWRIHLKNWLGASPKELHSYYKEKILRT